MVSVSSGREVRGKVETGTVLWMDRQRGSAALVVVSVVWMRLSGESNGGGG